ncbi:MAG: diaminopimelate decarboxylase [Anaerolineales bacterium]|nr:diaminopimelate decarboxylase [Anaerolineales bacterium]
MSGFRYVGGELCCEEVSLARLAAEHGTPLYVYSANAVRENYRRLSGAFAPLKPLICFAVKANFNLSVLRLLREEGAGFDIVSGGELYRALRAGADPARIVFAGVGKTDAELSEALKAGVGWVNLESADEAARLNALAAAQGQRATVALRLNPGVDPATHHHIRTGGAGSKFGIPVAEALALAAHWSDFPALDLRGAHLHIGSQVPNAAPTLVAIEIALGFMRQVPGLTTLDLGGGFPVAYRESDNFPPIEAFAATLVERLRPLAGQYHFHLEPGRYLVANSGAMVTTVQAVKDVAGRRTLVVDAGMQTLLRPALYDAYHRAAPLEGTEGAETVTTDVVGPICESADVLARERALPRLRPGGQLALLDAGAYGFAMASQYNSQPRPAEVLVDGSQARVTRRRERYEDLVELEEVQETRELGTQRTEGFEGAPWQWEDDGAIARQARRGKGYNGEKGVRGAGRE